MLRGTLRAKLQLIEVVVNGAMGQKPTSGFLMTLVTHLFGHQVCRQSGSRLGANAAPQPSGMRRSAISAYQLQPTGISSSLNS